MHHLQYSLGLEEPIHGIILGAQGGIGEALAQLLLDQDPANRLIVTYRSNPVLTFTGNSSVKQFKLDVTDETHWNHLVQELKMESKKFNLVLNATGLLSRKDESNTLQPERALRNLNYQQMHDIFAVNTFGVGLALKYLTPFLTRSSRSVFASFSARVGSIEDNRIGGWYSYRASKAAQNMLIKTASLELARTHKNCVCVALHPGTVYSALSSPFTARVKHTIFSPSESAGYLLKVLSELSVEDSGKLFAWDGSCIPF